MANIIAVTRFSESGSKAFASYINYIDRESAVRKENIVKYNIFDEYMDYMDDETKTVIGEQKGLEKVSALFTSKKDSLTYEEKQELKNLFKEAERKEIHKCKTVINLGFKAFAARISQECESIVIHNNIEQNKVFITENITKLVSTEYFKLYSILSAYEINEVNVATKLKEEWIKEVANSVISIIYDGQDSISRITQLNNRLMIYVGDYSTYINNKTFNT